MLKTLRIPLLIALAIFLLIQVVPVRGGDNPEVKSHMVWDGVHTEELVRAACYDCHSHETRWPWYSRIACFLVNG